MKRRDFIKQSLSASAVVVGTGYASFDMFRRTQPVAEMTVKERGLRAAARVVADGNPTSDEAMLDTLSSVIAEAKPELRVHSRPALAYEQHKAERLMAEIPAEGISTFAKNEDAPVIEEIVLSDTRPTGGPVSASDLNESAESVQEKVANFEANFHDDVVLTEEDYQMLVASLERVNRVQSYVGFGNFNILSFDDALKYARYSPRIGEFTKAELEFLDKMFHYDSSQLGFFGEKVVGKQTHVISEKDVIKMPGTGHYVFRGHSEKFYNQIRNEVGDSLILTSGVRNVMKQYQLFLAKTVQASGNMSRASRSLAPPGHSYHAIGDFDVGQVGGGLQNFTAAFAETDEFKRLQDLGYVRIRYTADNQLGVRYEPWHIRVV
ncbi:M15 family metallopeptidase [Reinekea blandensis]|uniref:M15 family metallopeptidase n=1 Tax=Reinekea blandensis TaxID=374838 RepID=UPI00030FF393|nr:M15 family metallopeptidase [Reinekea blandensis]